MKIKYRDSLKSTFPKLIGVGKNYIKLINQLQSQDIPKEPIIFLKPWTTLSFQTQDLKLFTTPNIRNITYQIQLGVYINKSGYNISKQNAMNHIGGYFLAIDFTDLALLKEFWQKSLPWDLPKGRDYFTPVGQLIEKKQIKNPYQIQLQLKLNDKIVQKDITANMHFKIQEIIQYTSSFMTLNEGDLIITGTPQGVGPVKTGDQLNAKMSIGDKIISQLNLMIF